MSGNGATAVIFEILFAADTGGESTRVDSGTGCRKRSKTDQVDAADCWGSDMDWE